MFCSVVDILFGAVVYIVCGRECPRESTCPRYIVFVYPRLLVLDTPLMSTTTERVVALLRTIGDAIEARAWDMAAYHVQRLADEVEGFGREPAEAPRPKGAGKRGAAHK